MIARQRNNQVTDSFLCLMQGKTEHVFRLGERNSRESENLTLERVDNTLQCSFSLIKLTKCLSLLSRQKFGERATLIYCP